ncbi:unnamed protein product, partial [Timema podura]|nr:unnamed protein product [Timema podura]
PPKIEPFSFPANIQEGARVHLTCVVSQGDTPLNLEWLKEGRPLAGEEADGATTYQIGEFDLALRISSVAPHHNGNYTCVAWNEAARSARTALLLVHGMLLLMSPSIVIPFQPQPSSRMLGPRAGTTDLSEGVRAQVTCVIERGDPPFTITWLKDSDPVPTESQWGLKIIGIDAHSSTIVVESLTAKHTGNFTCLAKNSVAQVAHTAQLVVSVPPRWLVEPQDVQAAEGVALFSMNCQAEGFPLPSITWRRAQGMRPGNYHDIDFGGSQGFRLQSNGSLLISRLGEEHEGYYLCEAVNGIGSGLSKIIYLTVNAPAHFLVKQKNQTARLGSITTLQCKVQGDNPLKIVWRKAGSTIDLANTHYRFNVKDVNISGGLASELTISNTDRSDGGRYACFASNSFGRDQMSVHLYVQEPPEFPRNVHVIEKGSRLVKLGWLLSPDGNSPITKYTVEYKTESDLWHDNMLQLSVSGSQANALVTGLRPATTYHFRLFAENQLGRSQPSDVLDVTTDGEAPGGAPRNVQVEATSSTELQVTWEAPESQLWNGDILGYHVGYKEQRVSADQYQYRSVENRLDISSLQRGEFILTDLMKFTSYSIVLQAYNALGPGPATQEIVASTLEDVPSAPPSSVACTALTSQSLQVSWDPPPHAQLHGLLKGYKLLWENTQQWETSSKPETKITTGLTVVVHGLEKHNNYSIQVLAFTRVGDGVPSTPLFCMTEEDVPEAPAGIKTVVSSGTSIIVSWLPPLHSNGIITTYNLQIRILSGAGQEAKMFRRSVPPQSTSYEAEGLLKRVRYEFVVAAVTRVGEGPSSDPVSMSPSTE